MIKFVLTAVYITITTGGIFLMKMGGDSLSLSLKNGFNFKIGYITTLGFIFYFVSFMLWQKLIVSFDLSYIVPITTGIVQILILIVAVLFFKETINIKEIMGVIFIIIGVVLISLGKV